MRFVSNLIGVDPDEVQQRHGRRAVLRRARRRRRAPAVPPAGREAVAMSASTAGRRPPSSASARPSSPRTPAAPSSSSPPRRRSPPSRDAGLTPADIDGMVTFTMDANDELALIRCLGIPELRFTGPHARRRRRRRAPRCSSPPAAVGVGRGRRGAGLPRVQRAVRPPLRPAAGGEQQVAGHAAGLELVPALRARHAGQDVRALVPALHARVRRHQRGLRPLHGRGPQARGAPTPTPGSTSGRITLEDHQASRWIVEPILRKLDCCQESDGGVAIVVTRAERAATCRHRRRCASRRPTQAHLARRRRDVRLLRRRPRRRSPRPRAWAGSSTRPTGLTPDDIDVAMIYENFTPDRVPAARGVRLLRSGRGQRLHRRRQHRGRREDAGEHQRRAARRGATSTA